MREEVTVEERIEALAGFGGAVAVEGPAVAGYAAVTERQRELYWTVPAYRLFESVAAHARLGVELLHSAGTQPRRAELGAAVAESNLLAGRIAFFDLQAPAQARRSYRTALAAADEIGDHMLASAILAHQAFIPAFAGTAQSARNFVDRARARVADGVSPAQDAWLYAVTAEVEARLHSDDAALEAMARSADAFGATETRERPPWLDYFDASRLAGFQGYCFLVAGSPERAATALRESLDNLPACAVKQRAIVLADLARSFVVRNEIEESCRLLSEAVELLSGNWYATALDRIREVRRLLASAGSIREISELDELLQPYRRVLPVD